MKNPMSGMKSRMKQMGKVKMPMQGKGVGGPSDLAKALSAARPAKASRLGSIKSQLFGKGGM